MAPAGSQGGPGPNSFQQAFPALPGAVGPAAPFQILPGTLPPELRHLPPPQQQAILQQRAAMAQQQQYAHMMQQQQAQMARVGPMAQSAPADLLAQLRAALTAARSAGDEAAARQLEERIEVQHKVEERHRRRMDKIHAMVRR